MGFGGCAALQKPQVPVAQLNRKIYFFLLRSSLGIGVLFLEDRWGHINVSFFHVEFWEINFRAKLKTLPLHSNKNHMNEVPKFSRYYPVFECDSGLLFLYMILSFYLSVESASVITSRSLIVFWVCKEFGISGTEKVSVLLN